MKVWIESEETCIHSRSDLTQPFGDWSASYDFKILGAYYNRIKSKIKNNIKSDIVRKNLNVDFKQAPKVVYILVVKYSTGDSFGSSSGHGYIQGLYLDKRTAENVKNKIYNQTYSRKDKSVWTGYFENLEYVDIIKTNLVKNRKK